MTIKELELAIRDLIRNIYCSEYGRKMELKELLTWDGRHRGYELKLDLNKPERPFMLSFEGDGKEFLKFLEKQLRFSGLNRIDYFEGYRCPCKNEEENGEDKCC